LEYEDHSNHEWSKKMKGSRMTTSYPRGRISILTRLSAFLSVALLVNCQCDENLESLPEPEIVLLNEDGLAHDEADPWLIIAFGDVDSGQSATQTLTIKNRGSGTLTLENLCLVSTTDYEEATSTAPCVQMTSTDYVFSNIVGTELRSDEEVELDISFSPQVGGDSNMFLRVDSNDEKSPIVAVQLTARGTAGRLCADTSTLDFGEVYVGDTKTMSLTLTNCGVRPVTIDTYALTQNPDNVFSVQVDGAEPVIPVTDLAENDSLVLDVTFAPTQERTYRDSLAGLAELTTAAPYEGQYIVVFVGDAKAPPECRVNVVPQTIQFGAVASSETSTQDLIIQSVGECACQVTQITAPDPTDIGFSIENMPTLPYTLRGTAGCEGDPDGSSDADNILTVEVSYTAPDRPNPSVDNATMTVTASDDETPRTINLEANGGGTPFCQFELTPQDSALGIGPGMSDRDGVVNFGRTTIYWTKRLPIEFENIGNTNCQINGFSFDDNTVANEFSLELFDGTVLSENGFSTITVEPGETQTFMAVFAPTHTVSSDLGELAIFCDFLGFNDISDIFEFGGYSSSTQACTLCDMSCNGLSFDTSDTQTETVSGVAGEFSVGFEATPVEPAIDIIPGEVDFGIVTLGCGSLEQRVNVYNTGAGELVLDEPYISPDNTPPDFVITSVQNPSGTWPYTLQPGAAMGIYLRYYANELGIVTGQLVLPTVEGGQEGPPVTVPLMGEGTLETEHTDYFDQQSDPTVDVLFVIDDSGSMDPFQQEIANNFDAFFTASNINESDYHIAVTTTLTTGEACLDISGVQSCPEHEMCGYYTSCGGNDRFLSTTSVDPESQFSCNVRVSDSGNVNPSRPSSDSAEGALQAARAFLSPPNIDDPAINGGFLREEAKLHVVMVSDEPDQSEGPVDLYVDFFQNIKGFRNESLIAVSAIAVPDQGCGDLSGNARYESVVTEMNGRFQDICDADWTTMMENLGLDSIGLQVEYFLSRAANPDTLEVCVRSNGPSDTNCVSIPQTSEGASDGYFYDSGSNTIVFNPGSIPIRGARIEVHYEMYCF
jgi:hypothetical protein